MNLLAWDLGFGDNKYVFGNSKGNMELVKKFPSVLAKVEANELVEDDKLVYGQYYVGEDALKIQSESIIELVNYDSIEQYAKVFLAHVLRKLPTMPDAIGVGLSIAHVENSGYYVDTIKEALKEFNMDIPVHVFPQGAIAARTIDKYGFDFPNANEDVMESVSYVGADIGMDTLDIFQVINGTPSTNLIRGIENSGIVVICKKLRDVVKSEYDLSITIPEAKEILDTGELRIRDNTINLESTINEAKSEYIEWLGSLIESQFGNVLNKMQFIGMFGGGSAVFKEYGKTGYYRRAQKRPEFYNSIAYYLKLVSMCEEGTIG